MLSWVSALLSPYATICCCASFMWATRTFLLVLVASVPLFACMCRILLKQLFPPTVQVECPTNIGHSGKFSKSSFLWVSSKQTCNVRKQSLSSGEFQILTRPAEVTCSILQKSFWVLIPTVVPIAKHKNEWWLSTLYQGFWVPAESPIETPIGCPCLAWRLNWASFFWICSIMLALPCCCITINQTQSCLLLHLCQWQNLLNQILTHIMSLWWKLQATQVMIPPVLIDTPYNMTTSTA